MKKTKLTRSLLAACSIVALSAVAYGCSSGISQSEADRQAAEAAAAAQAEAEAERQAAIEAERQAAAEAAAEAAAQAEAEKQAAVEAARQEAIAEQQQMAVMAATSFSADDTAMYGAQVTAIQANLALAEANIRAYRAEQERDAAQDQATAAERAKTAVENAIADLNAASAAEDTAEATYSDAADALEAAQQAVADADAESLAEASGVLAEALIAASTAAADLGVKTQAVADATAALMAARATLAEADPDHVALQAANEALEQAQKDKDELAKKVADLQKQIADLRAAQEKADKEREEAAQKKAEEERMKAMAAAGKALQAALGANPLGNIAAPSLTPAGLMVDAIAGAGSLPSSTDPDPVTLEAVKGSEGTLGDWKSMEYAHSDMGTKITNNAMVYTNQGKPTEKPFATGASFKAGGASDGADTELSTVDTVPSTLGEYNATSRTLALGAVSYAGGVDIKGDGFPTAGTTNYTPPDGSTENLIQGTYQGAPGRYRCIGTCSATATTGGGVTLTGTWFFIHNTGATTSKPDANYLFFGWWLSKDKNGDPTAASAFTGKVGLFNPDSATPPVETPLALNSITTGSATYTGVAAGKFAINDPLNGGDAGHFTADAELTAKFGAAAGAGVTGTIDNFMANDKAVPWSVALNNNTLVQDDTGTDGAAIADPAVAADPGSRAGSNLSATGGITSAPNYAWTDGNESLTTVWSIDGNAAAASGRWGAQMYDELPGTVAEEGDGSNVPTSVTGVFQSMFGSTHTMVGGFGAEN